MEIYLDYNATAPLMPAARAAVVAGLDLLNASSVHGPGRAARLAVTTARGQVATYLGVRPAQIVFTSSATEALVTALRGAAAKDYIISAVEHDAVRATIKAMQENSLLPAGRRCPEGADEGDAKDESENSPSPQNAKLASLTKHFGPLPAGRGEGFVIPVDPNGLIDLEKLDAMLKTTPAPALVAVQFVNNETGVIQPIAEVMKLCRKYGALLLCDAVQAVGRIDLAPLQGADIIVISTHKMGGPKGAAALVLREGLSITPLLTGGGQEERRRAGTENVAAIMGIGAAIERVGDSLHGMAQLAAWRDAMEREILSALPTVQIFGRGAARIANTSMMALPGTPASTQLMNLDLAGIAVSSGSACSSGKVGPSHVLTAMGAAPDIASAAIRVSGGWQNTAGDFRQFTKSYIEMALRLG